MDWFYDNFQIFALVGLALASWLKARMDAKQAEQEERRAKEEMAEGTGEFEMPEPWEEEEFDRPLPQETYQMPPPIPAVPPPIPASPPPIPPAAARAAAAAEEAAREAEAALLRHQLEIQERMSRIRERKAVTSGGASATRARSNARPGFAPPAQVESSSYKKLLADTDSIRRAVVMREILGPPLGLR